MTDEELGEVLREAYERHKSPAWLDTDDNPLTRYLPRVSERWAATVRDVRWQLQAGLGDREQTAAAILAALLDLAHDSDAGHIERAVKLTDALRARLAVKTCPANADGKHAAWHDDGPQTHCKCGAVLP